MEVSVRGVYCSQDDAPEGAVLEVKLIGDRRPKLSIWPVFTLKTT